MSRKMVRVSTEPVDGAKVLYNEASFNNMLRWAMRFVGWLLMVIACKSMLGAIVAMADGFSLLRTLVPDWRPLPLNLLLGTELALLIVLFSYWWSILPF